jgi:Tol biopolymer transport system component
MRASPVTVVRTALLLFAAMVACKDSTGPANGVINVAIISAGAGVDPNARFSLQMDGGASRTVGVMDAVTFDHLTPGDHTFLLSALPEQCTAIGANPRTVTAHSGQTVTTRFDVTCVARVGRVRVITVTMGASIDPDGYVAHIDGGVGSPISANGSFTFAGVAVGSHVMTLDGIAPNCGTPTRTLSVSVSFDATVDARFDIVCEANGSLRVTTATSGVDVDPDGYRITAIATNSHLEWIFGATDEKTISNLAAGSYTVTLDDVAANCVLAGANPRTITITSANTTTLSYTIACSALTKIAYASDISGHSEIYVVNSNGTGVQRLTNGSDANGEPAWSPDGSKIAFRSDHGTNADIYVMDANGTNPTRLTTDGGADSRPAWSPDGTRIAFVSTRDGHSEVYVMNANGTAQTRLTSSEPARSYDPAWSPDGTQIAFTSERAGNPELFVIRLDNLALTRLTTTTTARETEPAWSPDGRLLAYVRCAGSDCGLYTMRMDGPGVTLVYSGDVATPTWSPDGSRIAFTRNVCDYYYYYYYNYCAYSIWIVKADGSALVQLTDQSSFNPSWKR